ncbi:MAG: PEP-CTERM sorting domain-containing protein [Verrucomicrobia bacterium]|nr:PEP-CTERM sorting domain-containing protein [Verrucomicrobiota bacterium]
MKRDRTLSLRLTVCLVAAASLVWASVLPAKAAPVLIEDFNSFNLDFTYSSWTNATLVSNPNDYNVQAVNFGGGAYNINPNIDASGQTDVELDIDVNAGDFPNVIALLEDGDGTQYNYRWEVLAAGHHLLTFPISPVPQTVGIDDSFIGNPGTTPGLDLSDLSWLHLQVDPHGSGVPYDIFFNNLQLIPEPTSFLLLLAGGLVLGLLRRLMDYGA